MSDTQTKTSSVKNKLPPLADRLIDESQVRIALGGIGRSQLHEQYIANPDVDFPKPIKRGDKGKKYWLESAVVAFIRREHEEAQAL